MKGREVEREDEGVKEEGRGDYEKEVRAQCCRNQGGQHGEVCGKKEIRMQI